MSDFSTEMAVIWSENTPFGKRLKELCKTNNYEFISSKKDLSKIKDCKMAIILAELDWEDVQPGSLFGLEVLKNLRLVQGSALPCLIFSFLSFDQIQNLVQDEYIKNELSKTILINLPHSRLNNLELSPLFENKKKTAFNILDAFFHFELHLNLNQNNHVGALFPQIQFLRVSIQDLYQIGFKRDKSSFDEIKAVWRKEVLPRFKLLDACSKLLDDPEQPLDIYTLFSLLFESLEKKFKPEEFTCNDLRVMDVLLSKLEEYIFEEMAELFITH